MTRRALAALLTATLVACADPVEPTGPLRSTAPHRGPLRFAVVGDFGTGEAPEHAVAEAIRAWMTTHDGSVLVTTGDNVYDDGNPSDFEEVWHEPYGWVDRTGVDVVASIGNHDVGTDDGVPVMRLLGMPYRWYARRYGPVEFVVLDGNDLENPLQMGFLAAALRRSRAAWQVVVVHHPPYTCGRHDGEAEEVRDAIERVVADAGGDLVLSGHDHNYQRFPAIGGVTFVVSGGGGAELHEIEGCDDEPPEPLVAVDDAYHFLTGAATPERLRLSAITVPSGEVADTVTLRS